MMKSFKGQKGFTLIEIMIAVMIVAMISLLLWQSSAVIVKGKERFETEDIRFHEVLSVLTRMADDLSMTFLYQTVGHLGSARGEPQRTIQFLGKDNGDRDELHFASMSHIRYLKDSRENEQAEVSYLLKQSEEGEGVLWNLVKRVQSPPDREPEEGGIEYVVLEDVLTLEFQYYDDAREEWRREWDSTSLDFNKRLPKAVEISIEIKDPTIEDEKRSFKTTALLEMAPGPNDF